MTTNSQVLLLVLVSLIFSGFYTTRAIAATFSVEEASIDDFHLAFKRNQLTSRQLVEYYLARIRRLNPVLEGVIEVNPDALYLADKADEERKVKAPASSAGLHGIPILVKDNTATKDKMNTTAGSYALLRSIVPRDAGVVAKLRKAGAIILGKASLSEWSGSRSIRVPRGFCGRSGQGKNPYVLSATTCGSSSGSGISVAANMVAVALGTETDGSILCPSSLNSVVGIKPTVGLTSRAGVIPITPRQDTVGPVSKTVSDAVYVLDAIVGFDSSDAATEAAAKYIPKGGYRQFLKRNGLKDKRIGIVKNPFFKFTVDEGSVLSQTFKRHLQILRGEGAVLVDNLEIANIRTILNWTASGEQYAVLAEIKPALNAYLKQLVSSPVRSLADIIAFNKKFSKLEKLDQYGQDFFEAAESQDFGPALKPALQNLKKLSKNGIEDLVMKNKLDALVSPGYHNDPSTHDLAPDKTIVTVLAIGGYPGISVPAGYDKRGAPFGIYFGGLKGTEPKLIEIAYAFEQATKIRKPPTFKA